MEEGEDFAVAEGGSPMGDDGLGDVSSSEAGVDSFGEGGLLSVGIEARQHFLQNVEGKFASEDGGDLEDAAGVGGDLVYARHEDTLEGVGDIEGDAFAG